MDKFLDMYLMIAGGVVGFLLGLEIGYRQGKKKPFNPIKSIHFEEGTFEVITPKTPEDYFCMLHSQYNGEAITVVEQLVSEEFSGRELFEFCEYYAKKRYSKPDPETRIKIKRIRIGKHEEERE